MANDHRPSKKLVIDRDLIQAFMNGSLDPVLESQVAEFLAMNPEQLDKVVSATGDGFLQRMKEIKQRSLGTNSVSERALALGGSAIDVPSPKPAHSNQRHAPAKKPPARKKPSQLVIPAALATYPGYQITKELGRGGMGVVYLAKNVHMERWEVLKVLNERLLDHAGAKERFLREVKAVSKLSHPSIVTSYAILQLDNLLVFVMEFVNGMDLHRFINQHQHLPIDAACSLTRQLASGLQHAHERGIVHRDIKPSNVMVFKADRQLQLKILDFGLAKAGREKDAASMPRPAANPGLTQCGAMLGTPEYMSPEQTLNAAKADIRADIYSLGCTLYHMLAGRPPFTGTQSEILNAHCHREPLPINLIRPEVPLELARVVAQMMAKQPEKRYQIPSEVMFAVEPFLVHSMSSGIQGISSSSSNTVVDLASPSRDTSVMEVEPEESLPVENPSQPATTNRQQIAALMKVGKRGSLRTAGRRTQPSSIAQLKRHWPVFIPTVLTLFLLLWWNGTLFKINTPEGTIVFELLPADAEVFVGGSRVTLTWNEGKDRTEVKYAPGKYALEIIAGELRASGQTVEIQAGMDSIVRVAFAEKPQTDSKPTTGESLLESANAPSPIAKRTIPQNDSLLGKELLVNGSCEEVVNGTISGWTVTQGGWSVRRDDPAPHSGAGYFSPIPCAIAEQYQDISVASVGELIDRGSVSFSLGGATRSWRNQRADTSETIVEFRDESNERLLSIYSTGELGRGSQWREFSHQAAVPPNTRIIRIRLISRRNSGTGNDGYFDGLSLRLSAKQDESTEEPLDRKATIVFGGLEPQRRQVYQNQEHHGAKP